MKQPHCIIIVSTQETLEKVLSDPPSAVFVEEVMLDEQAEAVMEEHGYLSGIPGSGGMLFLRTDFDFGKYEIDDSFGILGLQWDKGKVKRP